MCTSILQIDVIIPTQTKYLDLIGSIGEHVAKELDHFTGDREALAYHLNLVLTEATANAIKHGRPENTVRITLHIQGHDLIIRVYDHGQGFNLDEVLIPDFDDPKEGGMGLFLIKTLMDSVTYTRNTDINVLEIIKHLS